MEHQHPAGLGEDLVEESIPHVVVAGAFEEILKPVAEAPVANFFLRISAKILSTSKNFCQNF